MNQDFRISEPLITQIMLIIRANQVNQRFRCLSQFRHLLQNIAQFLKTDFSIAVHIRIEIDISDRNPGKNPQHKHRVCQVRLAVPVHIAGYAGFGCAGYCEADVCAVAET